MWPAVKIAQMLQHTDKHTHHCITTCLRYTAAAPTFMERHAVPSAGDWALDRFAAVFLQGTEGVVIDNCTFERLDGNAVMVSGYNRNATVQVHMNTHTHTHTHTHINTRCVCVCMCLCVCVCVCVCERERETETHIRTHRHTPTQTHTHTHTHTITTITTTLKQFLVLQLVSRLEPLQNIEHYVHSGMFN